MARRRVLLTGATGYISHQLIDVFRERYDLVLLDSQATSKHRDLDAVAIADLTNEVTDSDYAEQTLASVTWTKSGSTTTLDAADESFGDPVTITAKYAVIYDDTVASPVIDPLVCYVDLDTGGGSVSSTASSFDINMNASGILTLGGATS